MNLEDKSHQDYESTECKECLDVCVVVLSFNPISQDTHLQPSSHVYTDVFRTPDCRVKANLLPFPLRILST